MPFAWKRRAVILVGADYITKCDRNIFGYWVNADAAGDDDDT